MTEIENKLNAHEANEALIHPRHIRIGIEGPMGIGKSTLMKKLAEYWPGVKVIDEVIANNPHMPKAYLEPERYSFPSQICQLGNKVISLQEVKRLEKIAPVVFITLENDLGYAISYLSGDELSTYMLLYNLMVDLDVVPQPDVILKLVIEDKPLFDRVQKRDRDFEKPVKEEFLTKLNGIMAENVKKSGVPVIEINAEHYDFRKEEKMADLVESIEYQINNKLRDKFKNPSSGVSLPPFIEEKGVWV